MKKRFFIGCFFVFVLCFGVSFLLMHIKPNEESQRELLVYRNGAIIQDSLSLSDEEFVERIQYEHPEIKEDTVVENKDIAEKQNYGWYSTEIYVENLLPGTEYVIVLEYLNLKSEVIEALLYTPDLSKSYSKDMMSMSGRIVFPLTQWEEGAYKVVIYGTGDIGGYTTYIVKKEDFVKLQEPNMEYPRDLMREDALIDE